MPSEQTGEDGLTLVEMLVAIVVIGFVLMAMAGVAFASLRSVQTTERVTAATQLGNELLEAYAGMPYDDLGLYTDEVVGTSFEGAALVLFAAASPRDSRVPYATQTISRDGVDYDVDTAVVWVDDPDPAAPSAQDYKRVVVTLAWDSAGRPQSTRVEALRAPGPADQPLSVTVTPDVVELDDDGEQLQPVTITVEAKEPQTTVTLQWLERDGTNAGPTTMVDQGARRLWTTTLDGRYFANGATLFTVKGTLAGTTQQEITTVGRGLFLQPLHFPGGQTTVTPPVVTYQPAFESDPGEFCVGAVRIDTHVNGAILSDPVTASINPGTADEVALPLTGDEQPTTSGSRFWADVPVADLRITGPGDVPVTLTVTRPVGEVQPFSTANIVVPVEATAARHDDEGNVTGYEPCP